MQVGGPGDDGAATAAAKAVADFDVVAECDTQNTAHNDVTGDDGVGQHVVQGDFSVV